MSAVELGLLVDRRTIRTLDTVVGLWSLGFLSLGTLSGMHLWGLSQFTASIVQAAFALDETSDSLAILENLPLIGTQFGPLVNSFHATASGMRGNATNAESDVRILAIVIGLSVALAGSLPVVLFYLPLRVIQRRNITALARLVHDPVDPRLVEQLAMAAVIRLPYHKLQNLTPSPTRDLVEGRHQRLAAAELHRLGVQPPREWLNRLPD